MNTDGCILLSRSEEESWEKARRAASEMGEVAGLFRGWKPSGLDQSAARILYVGKATSGTFHEENVEASAFNGKGAFWDFARSIAKALGYAEGLTCIAWSNISKISRPQIAADADLVKPFEKLAIESLNGEVERCQPDLVVFVTGHFNDTVVREVSKVTTIRSG